MLFEMRGAEAAGSTSFDVAGQDGRGKHPQRLMPFDMAKRRVRGVVTMFVEGKAGGLHLGCLRGVEKEAGLTCGLNHPHLEVFTLPPYSTWNPCGIYVESMLFHMESAHSIWNMFWLRSHPFW